MENKQHKDLNNLSQQELIDLLLKANQQVDLLHSAMHGLQATVDGLNSAMSDAEQIYQEKLQEKDEHILALKQEIRQLKNYLYGRRRERHAPSPLQPEFDFDAMEGESGLVDLVLPEAEASEATPDSRPAKKPRKPRELKYLGLPTNTVEIDLPNEEKICQTCNCHKVAIGVDESKMLNFIPARVELTIHRIHKYACPKCPAQGVSSPPPPPRPLSRCIAGPGLLAQMYLSKFAFHSTNYRFEDMLNSLGLHVPRSTMSDWLGRLADMLQPLYELQRQRVVSGEVIWTDDTSVKVLDKSTPGGSDCSMWVYLGDASAPYEIHDFTQKHNREGPLTFLEGFKGYLQADAANIYDQIYVQVPDGVREVACWAHARRKIYERENDHPAPAKLLLELIKRLYAVEDASRDLDDAGRAARRQELAKPILEQIGKQVDRIEKTILPKSKFAEGLRYIKNHWRSLCRYVEDGRLTIDNNVAERRIREIATGRKNWLFLGSLAASPRAAILYTIVASAKRHHLDLWSYINSVILGMYDESANWEQFLPDRWAQTHPEHILKHRIEESREKARRQAERRKYGRKGKG